MNTPLCKALKTKAFQKIKQISELQENGKNHNRDKSSATSLEEAQQSYSLGEAQHR